VKSIDGNENTIAEYIHHLEIKAGTGAARVNWTRRFAFFPLSQYFDERCESRQYV
jgi:hypothetical protein